MRRGLAAALWLIAVCGLGQTLPPGPRNFDASDFGSRIRLGPEWLFAPGDDPSYALPFIDDSHWRVVSTQNQLSEYGYRGLHHSWYRMAYSSILRPGKAQILQLARITPQKSAWF